MSLPNGYSLVSPGDARIDDFFDVDAWAFMFEPRDIDAAAMRAQFPAARARAAEITSAERGQVGDLVGVYSVCAYGMLVPGGATIPVAGLTWVGVHPGHRRRGILRAMIDDHFAQALAAGESVGTLFAMEAPIYGRFGYASAAPRLRFNIGEMHDVPGSADLPLRFERADPARHEGVVRAVHARLQRPGTVTDPSPEMLAELLNTFPSDLEDGERTIIAIVEDAEGPAAYACFKRTMKTEGPSPTATLVVNMGSAATTASARRLYGTLKELDLVDEALMRATAPDDPLITLAKDVRSLKAVLLDALWVRILDLPAALAARSYAADVDVVIEVADPQLPANAGTWRLRAVNGSAEVTRAQGQPDVTLSIQDLSGAYLGSEYLRRASIAGTISEHTPGTLRALNDAMRTDMEPLGNMWF